MNVGWFRPSSKASGVCVLVVWWLGALAGVPTSWANSGGEDEASASGGRASPPTIGGVQAIEFNGSTAILLGNVPTTITAPRSSGLVTSVAEASVVRTPEYRNGREGSQGTGGEVGSHLQSDVVRVPDNDDRFGATPDAVLLLCAVVVIGLVAVARRDSA